MLNYIVQTTHGLDSGTAGVPPYASFSSAANSKLLERMGQHSKRKIKFVSLLFTIDVGEIGLAIMLVKITVIQR